jgi:hypothetical protein
MRRSAEDGGAARVGRAAVVALSCLAAPANAGEEGAPRAEVAVLWISPSEPCPVDPPAVFAEVRRVFSPVPLGLVWREEPPESESVPGEVRIIGLRRDRTRRAHPALGVTARGVEDTAWVVCSEVARAIGAAPDARSPRLDIAVARVIAHELVHVLFPSVPHSLQGLMAPVVDAATLTGPAGELDAHVRRALVRRLESPSALARNGRNPTPERSAQATR